jgi:hypothetical protein
LACTGGRFPQPLSECGLQTTETANRKALYQTFPAEEARRLLRRLEFHYVPKHASWLNMVEIEIGALRPLAGDLRQEAAEPQ